MERNTLTENNTDNIIQKETPNNTMTIANQPIEIIEDYFGPVTSIIGGGADNIILGEIG